MKRGLAFLFIISIIIILSLSFISAGFFSDAGKFFAKITGMAGGSDDTRTWILNSNLESADNWQTAGVIEFTSLYTASEPDVKAYFGTKFAALKYCSTCYAKPSLKQTINPIIADSLAGEYELCAYGANLGGASRGTICFNGKCIATDSSSSIGQWKKYCVISSVAKGSTINIELNAFDKTHYFAWDGVTITKKENSGEIPNTNIPYVNIESPTQSIPFEISVDSNIKSFQINFTATNVEKVAMGVANASGHVLCHTSEINKREGINDSLISLSRKDIFVPYYIETPGGFRYGYTFTCNFSDKFLFPETSYGITLIGAKDINSDGDYSDNNESVFVLEPNAVIIKTSSPQIEIISPKKTSPLITNKTGIINVTFSAKNTNSVAIAVSNASGFNICHTRDLNVNGSSLIPLNHQKIVTLDNSKYSFNCNVKNNPSNGSYGLVVIGAKDINRDGDTNDDKETNLVAEQDAVIIKNVIVTEPEPEPEPVPEPILVGNAGANLTVIIENASGFYEPISNEAVYLSSLSGEDSTQARGVTNSEGKVIFSGIDEGGYEIKSGGVNSLYIQKIEHVYVPENISRQIYIELVLRTAIPGAKPEITSVWPNEVGFIGINQEFTFIISGKNFDENTNVYLDGRAIDESVNAYVNLISSDIIEVVFHNIRKDGKIALKDIAPGVSSTIVSDGYYLMDEEKGFTAIPSDNPQAIKGPHKFSVSSPDLQEKGLKSIFSYFLRLFGGGSDSKTGDWKVVDDPSKCDDMSSSHPVGLKFVCSGENEIAYIPREEIKIWQAISFGNNKFACGLVTERTVSLKKACLEYKKADGTKIEKAYDKLYEVKEGRNTINFIAAALCLSPELIPGLPPGTSTLCTIIADELVLDEDRQTSSIIGYFIFPDYLTYSYEEMEKNVCDPKSFPMEYDSYRKSYEDKKDFDIRFEELNYTFSQKALHKEKEMTRKYVSVTEAGFSLCELKHFEGDFLEDNKSWTKGTIGQIDKIIDPIIPFKPDMTQVYDVDRKVVSYPCGKGTLEDKKINIDYALTMQDRTKSKKFPSDPNNFGYKDSCKEDYEYGWVPVPPEVFGHGWEACEIVESTIKQEGSLGCDATYPLPDWSFNLYV